MAVNTQFGNFKESLDYLRKSGIYLIPPPPKEYYTLSEIDLAQRVLLPNLFNLVGIRAFDLPY
jgi:hypothetical protein